LVAKFRYYRWKVFIGYALPWQRKLSVSLRFRWPLKRCLIISSPVIAVNNSRYKVVQNNVYLGPQAISYLLTEYCFLIPPFGKLRSIRFLVIVEHHQIFTTDLWVTDVSKRHHVFKAVVLVSLKLRCDIMVLF
jgi:hypothetical protein